LVAVSKGYQPIENATFLSALLPVHGSVLVQTDDT